MKSLLKSDRFRGTAIVAVIMAGFAILANTPDHAHDEIPVEGEGAESPVLVELFTSEGCSSCPPAEKIMNQMIEQDVVLGADVVALQFHVDYWDYLGWKDPYSNSEFSDRQREYAQAFKSRSIYTPQMIVDGKTEFTGSHAGKALDAIDQAKRQEKVAIKLESSFADHTLNLGITSSEIASPDQSYGVYLAIAENNLVQEVKSGENRGKTLPHHGVVRYLKKIGTLPPQQTVDFKSSLEIPEEWDFDNLSAVVFLQQPRTRHIAGVVQTSLK